MKLVRKTWNKKDIEEFNKYLESIKIQEKVEFTKKISNTKMEVLAIPIPELRKIANEISKGNFINYLDCFNNKYYENTIINAVLINKINDIQAKKHYI